MKRNFHAKNLPPTTTRVCLYPILQWACLISGTGRDPVPEIRHALLQYPYLEYFSLKIYISLQYGIILKYLIR